MDKIERRRGLVTKRDPDPRLDYVVTLGGEIAAAAVSVSVRYVPDRLILDPAGFAAYLETLGRGDWESLEEIAVAVLDDINNETVARWVQVTVAATGDGAASHSVMIEDRQPRWDNPALLGRLRRY